MAFYIAKTIFGGRQCIRHGCTEAAVHMACNGHWWRQYEKTGATENGGMVLEVCETHRGLGWKRRPNQPQA